MRILEKPDGMLFNVRCNNYCCFALIEISQYELQWNNSENYCYKFDCPACNQSSILSSSELWNDY